MTEVEQREIFSANLRRLMAIQNKTQADMVRMFDISKSTASSWCVGSKMPRMGKVDALAAWLGVRRSALLEENGNAPDESIILLNRAAEKMTPEQRQKLIDMAKVVFADAFGD